MSPVAQNILRRLDEARQRWWLFTLLTTAVMAGCASLALLLVFVLSDALVTFSQTGLTVLLLVWLAVTVAMVVLVIRRVVRSQRSLEAAARRVEMEFPELGSDLINLVQLAGDMQNVDRAFCEAAIHQAAIRLGQIPFEDAPKRETRWRRFLYGMQTPRDLGESFLTLSLLIAAAVIGHLMLPNWSSAANRLMRPWEFVPSVGSVEILRVTPGNTDVLVGSSLDIAAEIRNPQGKAYQATLFVTPEGDPQESGVPMAADEKHQRYQFTLPAVLKPLKYRLQIGDSQTEIFAVGVREKPTIVETEVTFHYPAYLERPPQTFMQKQIDLEAPQYTEAELHVRPSVPIARGHIQCESQKYVGRVENRGALLMVRFPLLKDATFSVHLFNDAGHSDPNPRLNRITVTPDKPPVVELLKPGRQETIAPGAEVPVMIRAGDDHGVGRVRLEMKVKASEPAGGEASEPAEEVIPITVQDWTDLGSKTTAVLHHRLPLGEDKVKPGQTVLVRATSWDKRNIGQWGLDLKPQQAESAWHSLRVVDGDAKAAAALEQLENLRSAVWKILEKQIRARMRTGMILQKTSPAEAISLAGEVRSHQVDVQKSSLAVVKSITDTDKEERLAVKRVLNQLAVGDMLAAVGQCDGLVKITSLDAFAQPVDLLVETQDRIVDVLRRILDVARQAQNEALAEMKKRPGGDLPDDTRKKLEEMRNKLDEMLQRQKKVIEASENLAKKPVEDYSEEDEQLLKQLAAAEDEFAKFMKELQTDLSKLPEQDFANPSMLKELVEIQTEIKMAEDALLKKSADIAVPLEQLGYERAEEIKTNLEKWLPDTPDRERWSQEESLTDADKEAPMAELPGELEDLIGELMEEEEDLFDEMEDISSSAADSLDKGAGWDAADGPISNMSAKGVTGNRLPNTSEIGGRAGEGRQGKSSGEFVGDEAVGKGGRKTPSRLTPDPYMKGQIKDHSKDPVGGATGGGKESGEGGEGLEGPSPGPKGEREMHRLAGKQAALRNKAEGIDLQFQISNFHRTDLKKLIDTMAQIEQDLKAGRYQSALRQRQVMLEGLGSVKQYLEGEFEVRKDTTANLPTDIQKEILGSMQDPSPAGWEELNRRYFERLSTGGP